MTKKKKNQTQNLLIMCTMSYIRPLEKTLIILLGSRIFNANITNTWNTLVPLSTFHTWNPTIELIKQREIFFLSCQAIDNIHLIKMDNLIKYILYIYISTPLK